MDFWHLLLQPLSFLFVVILRRTRPGNNTNTSVYSLFLASLQKHTYKQKGRQNHFAELFFEHFCIIQGFHISPYFTRFLITLNNSCRIFTFYSSWFSQWYQRYFRLYRIFLANFSKLRTILRFLPHTYVVNRPQGFISRTNVLYSAHSGNSVPLVWSNFVFYFFIYNDAT